MTTQRPLASTFAAPTTLKFATGSRDSVEYAIAWVSVEDFNLPRVLILRWFRHKTNIPTPQPTTN